MTCRISLLLLSCLLPEVIAVQQPVFRTSVDVYRLDVSVLDERGNPIRGLSSSDFSVREDGVMQQVLDVSEIHVRPPESESRWIDATHSDVTSNQFTGTRLFVILIDDATIPCDPYARRTALAITHSIVDHLGPSDVASVVFTRDNRNAQDFTGDHERLHRAVSKIGCQSGDKKQGEAASLGALGELVRYLIELPDRRKAIAYVTLGMKIPLADLAPNQILDPRAGRSMVDREHSISQFGRLLNVFRLAAQANVNVYTYDVCGLRALGGVASDPCQGSADIDDFFRTVANETGGRATANVNEFNEGVDRMFHENNAYYLVSYKSSSNKPPGTYRRIAIEVDRPKAEVRARTAWFAESKVTSERASPSLTAHLSGLLPDGALPLELFLVPFAGEVLDKPTVVFGVQVQEAGDVRALADLHTLQVLVEAFDPEGRSKATKTLKANLRTRPDAQGPLQFEFVSELPLPPGRYELRVAATHTESKVFGSVYGDVDIPNYSRETFALAGIVLSAVPNIPAATDTDVRNLLPVVPTVSRTFVRDAKLTAFARLYHRKSEQPEPENVILSWSVFDEAGNAIGSLVQTLSPSEWLTRSSVDSTFVVPLTGRSAGRYVVEVTATVNGQRVDMKALQVRIQ